MDKQEYKMRAEEIKALISKREFFKAVKIADEIDWTRVRSVAMLCTVSDLYKVNRRYKESKELLLMAYERHPNGRMILYSLCELCLKMGELVQAIEYYKEFVQLAPMDNGKYILQYKIYVAQEVSLEERIAVLEEFKKREYREKWGYELAYLYHRIGLSTRCVEECDELILWFSDGRYVKKAMELKMLHQPLTAAQEANYNSFIGKDAVLPKPSSALEEKKEEEIQVQTVNVGQYDTINLQKALAESMKEVLEPASHKEEMIQEVPNIKTGMGEVTSQIMAPMLDEEKQVYYEDKTGELSQEVTEIISSQVQDIEIVLSEGREEIVQEEVVHQEEIIEIKSESAPTLKEEENSSALAVAAMSSGVTEDPKKQTEDHNDILEEVTKEIPSVREIMNHSLSMSTETENKETVPEPVFDLSGSMETVLSQEYDGQISLVVPEDVKIEKQITGQMNIEDVLSEWERTKKVHEEKRRAQLTQKVLEQTGNMFTEFEEKIRDGILEQLEKEESLHQTVEEKSISDEDLDQKILLEIKETILEKQKALEDVEEREILSEEKEERDSNLQESEISKEENSEENNIEEEKTDEEETLDKILKEQEEIRDLTEEEKTLFGTFLQTKGARRRFLKARDLVSLSAYTGNIIVTGEADQDTMKMAKNLLKDIQLTDSNFSGVIAKVTGSSLNSKSVESTINKLNNGGLIIEKASGMNSQAVTKLLKALNQEQTGIVVILEDNKKAIKRMLAAYPSMSSFFNARFEIEELNNDALAAYGRQYAAHLEYSIDDLGMLALQTKIEDRQTSDHIVTVVEVRELVDDAIYHANRKNLTHLFDLILGKRYDDNDMIILREKDFI